MMQDRNYVELPEKDVLKNIKVFHNMLNSFEHAVKSLPGAGGHRTFVAGMNRQSLTHQSITIRLIQTISNISPEIPLETCHQHLVITSLLRGLCIADAVTSVFSKQSGLQPLKDQNSAGLLPVSEVAKFNEMINASSFIALQVVANYMLFKLSSVDSSAEIIAPEVIPYSLNTSLSAAKDILAALNDFLQLNVSDDDALIAASKVFFEKLLDELAVQQGGLPSLAPALGNGYHTKQDNFTAVIGERTNPVSNKPLIMDFKKPQDVVGNAIAKYQAMKLAKMMMCYDFERQLNPFVELGGYIYTWLGDGAPGTGKTTVIQMLAGLLHDYCKHVGYPFYFENLSVESLDSYQGKSAQNAKAFIRNVSNPQVIGFGTIDDIDQICSRRDDNKASAGQSEITAVLMESFAGANTIIRGNASYAMFTNHAEKIDDALRQRAGARFLIDGPVTTEDFIDLLALLLGENHNIPVGDIELFVTQHIQKAVAASYEKHSLPQEARLQEIYEATLKQHGELDTLEKIGRYLKNIQLADHRFTGRAVRNIVNAAQVRSMDIDLPDEFMEDPKVFLLLPYDQKKTILMEDFRYPITPEVLLQEINRYADSEFRYASNSDEAEINNLVRTMDLHNKASIRYKGNLK